MGSENQVLMVIANKDFQDVEFGETKTALESAGIDVKIGAKNQGDCMGVMGTSVVTDIDLLNADPLMFDAVIFIGGVGVESYLSEPIILDVAKNFYKSGKLVGAICWAPAILANAGILAGKRATVWSGSKEILEKRGAEYTGEAVTVDGTIVTGNGPDAATQFGSTLAKMITGVEY